MNILNIEDLSKQLESLGFNNLGYLLLKKVCFKPVSFSLMQSIEKGKDLLSVEIYFEKDHGTGDYLIKFYDATFLKEQVVQEEVINGVDISVLEKSFKAIDWKLIFDPAAMKSWSAEDKSSWEIEQKVASIVDDIARLGSSAEGRLYADEIKRKYWSGIPFHENYCGLSPAKIKGDITQRFYFFEGQEGISVDECHRFLQNRWLEKQLLIKTRPVKTAPQNTGDSKIKVGTLNNNKRTYKKPQPVK